MRQTPPLWMVPLKLLIVPLKLLIHTLLCLCFLLVFRLPRVRERERERERECSMVVVVLRAEMTGLQWCHSAFWMTHTPERQQEDTWNTPGKHLEDTWNCEPVTKHKSPLNPKDQP